MIRFSREHFEADFPFLATSQVAYLDNASTTQRPHKVLQAMDDYYTEYNANVHRGIYAISEKASAQYEAVRGKVAGLLNAASENEIIFTTGTTGGLNLAARLIAQDLKEGDEIVLSNLEHHANVIPWQLVAREVGATLVYVPLNENDQLTVDALKSVMTDRSRVLAITHMSNVTGYTPPLAEMLAAARERNMYTVVDAAQSVPHHTVDVQALGCDFLAFSAHKLCGPTGVGALYGRAELLERFEPVVGGGSMIDTVNDQDSTWAPVPLKFEPGTPNIAGVIGMGAAIDYILQLDPDRTDIHERVHELYLYGLKQFEQLPEVTLLGPTNPDVRTGIFSFVVEGIHPHDIAAALDQVNVAVRVGHHCAQPLMKHWNVPATVRASLYFYNEEEEIDRLIAGLKEAITLLKK